MSRPLPDRVADKASTGLAAAQDPQRVATEVIREFIVRQVGHDAGPGMTDQAQQLAGELARAGCLASSTTARVHQRVPGPDAVRLVEQFEQSRYSQIAPTGELRLLAQFILNALFARPSADNTTSSGQSAGGATLPPA